MRFFISVTGFLYLLFAASIALAKPVPVEHYSRLPAVYDAALSPDGRFLVAITDNEGQYIIRVFNIADPEDTKLRASTYPKDVRVNWVKWANNDTILLSVQKAEKIYGTIAYVGYLYALNKDVTTSQLILKPNIKKTTARPGDFRQFNNTIINFLPNDPDHILMMFGKEKAISLGVHKVNINTRRSKRMERGTEDIQHWITDLRGEVRVGAGRKDRTGDWRMKIRDAHSDKWRPVKDYPGLEAGTPVFGFMGNPNELIIGSRDGKDTLGLFIYDLAQKKHTRKLFQHDKYDVDGIIKSADGTEVVGASYTDDTTKREFFDPATKSRMATIQKNFIDYQIDIIEQTRNGNKILFKASSPSVPPSLYVFDFTTNKINILARDYPEIGSTHQGNVSKVRYTARDGFVIPGYVTTPPKIGAGEVAFKNQPFIIMPHGGPYARDTHSFDYMAQLFASRGYSVLQMNFRGSEGFGHAHEQAGRKNWEIMQEDVEDGTRWLIDKGYADKQRICIVGWSYGGYAALMAAIKHPELYACTASIAGVTDLKDMIGDMKKYRFGRHTAKHFLIKGFSGKDDIKANSPVKRAKEITIPLFLAHGTDDVNVHFDQFARMKRALKKSKAKTTFMKFKDEDHYFIDYENRTKLLTGLDKFLNKNLGKSEAAP